MMSFLFVMDVPCVMVFFFFFFHFKTEVISFLAVNVSILAVCSFGFTCSWFKIRFCH